MAKKKQAATTARKKAAPKKAAVKKTSTAKKSSKKSPTAKKKTPAKKKRKAARRELIDTGVQKRYVRRNEEGQFKEVDDVGRSLAQDRRKKAKKTVKAGQGDKGDQAPRE